MDDKISSFKERMASVMDAISAACPPTSTPGGRLQPSPTLRQSEEEDHSSSLARRSLAAHPQSARHQDHRELDRHGQRSGPRRSRTTSRPDHAINPSKWTKYDLSDDGTKELKRRGLSAEQVNKRAAFEFLREQKSKRLEDEEMEEAGGQEGKMVFKKPAKKTDVDGGKERSVRGGSGAHVMPEYVVGEKREGRGEKGRKREVVACAGETEESESTRKSKSESSISLSHLEEEEQTDETKANRKRNRSDFLREKEESDEKGNKEEDEARKNTVIFRKKRTMVNLSHLEEDVDDN